MTRLIDSFMQRATSILALLGAIGIIAMLVHITAYVVGRHFMASPVPATVEIVSQYYMVLIGFLPLAWAERRGDMITVEVFGSLFRGPFKTLNAVFVAVVTAAAYAALTYTTWSVALREFAAKSYVISLSVAVPVWPSYFVLPLSFGFGTLVALIRVYLILAHSGTPPVAPHDPEEEFVE